MRNLPGDGGDQVLGARDDRGPASRSRPDESQRRLDLGLHAAGPELAGGQVTSTIRKGIVDVAGNQRQFRQTQLQDVG